MRCILTGLGGRGLHWLGVVRQREDIEVAAFVEPFEGSITRAVTRHGVPRERIFSTLDEALGSARADFVLDVTPPAVHHEIALKAFAAGLSVLGEKPLSDNFETAKMVARKAEEAGVKHMITQNYRFGAQPRTSRQLIADGLIGEPGQCDVRFTMPWADIPGSHYVTQPFMLINDMMVHHFDLMRSVLGQNPQSVQAMTWNQPWGWHAGDSCHAIVFEYASGLRSTHVCVGCAVGSQTSWNGDWRIEGPRGSLDWDKDGTWHSRLHRLQPGEEATDRQAVAHLDVPPPEVAMVDEFLAAIRENREPECSARDNLESLRMVFGAIESAQRGAKVDLRTL